MIAALLGGLALASLGYQLLAFAAARRFFGRGPSAPPTDDNLPGVSVLIPLCGAEFGALESLSSVAAQDYPDFEILFAAARAEDPGLQALEALKAAFPARTVRVCSAPQAPLAGNPKVALLAALARSAKHPVLVCCDSDVRLAPGSLRGVVRELEGPDVGLVTAPYRTAGCASLPARLEALGIECTFLPSVVLAHRWLGLRFALGAMNAMRRADLEAIGGFDALAEMLADDHELGAQMARSGRKVLLSRTLASTVVGPTRWIDLWRREVRWARTIRTSRPAHYPGMALTFTTPLALLALAASAGAPWGWGIALCAVALRWGVAGAMLRLTGHRELARALWLLPLRDAMSAAVWATGAFGREVIWRGRRLTLDREGRIVAERPLQVPGAPRPGLPARAIRGLDALLRSHYGIFDLADDARCLLRVRIVAAEHDVTLADGTRVLRGERVAELHLWNEHVGRGQSTLSSLAWARRLCDDARHSLEVLARTLAQDARFHGIEAFLCDTYLVAFARLLPHWGFEPEPVRSAPMRDFWNRMHLRLLLLAYNPRAALTQRDLRRVRLWLSRRELLTRYGAVVA